MLIADRPWPPHRHWWGGNAEWSTSTFVHLCTSLLPLLAHVGILTELLHYTKDLSLQKHTRWGRNGRNFSLRHPSSPKKTWNHKMAEWSSSQEGHQGSEWRLPTSCMRRTLEYTSEVAPRSMLNRRFSKFVRQHPGPRAASSFFTSIWVILAASKHLWMLSRRKSPSCTSCGQSISASAFYVALPESGSRGSLTQSSNQSYLHPEDFMQPKDFSSRLKRLTIKFQEQCRRFSATSRQCFKAGYRAAARHKLFGAFSSHEASLTLDGEHGSSWE